MNVDVTPTIGADLYRELEKARDVLEVVDRYLSHQAAMNAALHLAEQVRPNPLAARVATALAELDQAVARLTAAPPAAETGDV